jgi:hypothetical protein
MSSSVNFIDQVVSSNVDEESPPLACEKSKSEIWRGRQVGNNFMPLETETLVLKVLVASGLVTSQLQLCRLCAFQVKSRQTRENDFKPASLLCQMRASLSDLKALYLMSSHIIIFDLRRTIYHKTCIHIRNVSNIEICANICRGEIHVPTCLC